MPSCSAWRTVTSPCSPGIAGWFRCRRDTGFSPKATRRAGLAAGATRARRFGFARGGRAAPAARAPGPRQLIVEPRGQGVLLGLSCLVPPYQWQFSATAVADAMTFEFNADAVRTACESD